MREFFNKNPARYASDGILTVRHLVLPVAGGGAGAEQAMQKAREAVTALRANTPVEAVLDDRPRRDSLIFSVNVWQPMGTEPASIMQVLSRQKDIQYASRGKAHVARQEQIHRLRHVVRQLETRFSEEQRNDPELRELLSYGCGTTMHLVRLLSPRVDREDHTKDIDFTRAGIRTRWQAGYAHAQRALAEKPWEREVDPLQGIFIHETVE